MPSTSITWKAILDERTCPICRAMHGYKWTFGVKEGIPDELVHPQFGVVWNVARGSQAHGHERYNCRCTIIPEIHVADLKQKVEQLLHETEQKMKIEAPT